MKHLLPSALAFAMPLLLASTAWSQFSPGPNPITGTVTSPQTISTGTGTVNAGATLSVTGNNVAITATGASTITNNGTIQQTSVLTGGSAGNSRAIRDNTGGFALTINNGSVSNATALIQTASADCIQMNKANSSVTLNNWGTINSQNLAAGGNQAIDWNAITTGTNTLNNFSTGMITATEADAVRPGVNGTITNDGTIKSTTTTGSSSDGVDAQNNSGVSITNANTSNAANANLIEGGRHGITGGALNNTVTFTMSITNNVNGTIKGDNGSGVNIDGFNALETVTIHNGGTITGNGVTGDGDGVDVDGLVNLTNTGTIKSINSFSATTPAQSEGVTVGGGTIVNSGTIEGDVANGNTNAVGRGITLAGIDTSGTPEPIYANSTITNQNGGLIKGQTDSAIAVGGGASGFTITINNNAGGTIQGGSATAAAILTGADNDTINNAGAINGTSSGKAIDMGGGNNTLNITGGTASVLGDISGGVGGTNALVIDPGGGNSFSYNGSISNFNSAEVRSGTVTLSGASTYSGSTLVSGGTLLVNNASGSATGSGAVTVSSGATLGGNGFIDAGANTITINGTLSPGNSPGTIHLASSSVSAAALLLSSTSTLVFDLTSTSVKDLVSLTATNLTLGGGALALVLPDTSPTGIDYNGTYAIFTGINGAATGAFGTVTGFDTTDYRAVFNQNGSELDLSFAAVAAVPEPGTWLSAGLALATLLLTGRHRVRARGREQVIG